MAGNKDQEVILSGRITLLQKISLSEKQNNTSVALGQFDGLHIGHKAVILAARQENLTTAVLTFKRGTLKKGDDRFLTTDAQREAIFAQYGAELLCEPDFSEIRGLSAESFVEDILISRLGARHVVCGFNYRFGCGASGNAEILQKLCRDRNIDCTVVPDVEINGRSVSSTAIRRFLDEGDAENAALMLGRPFSYDFEVIGGKQLGRTLGTPTINQAFPEGFICPKFGVYASSAEVDGKEYCAVTNIGVKPTVGSDMPLSETWICDYSGDLYGQHIKVSLVKYLRPEQKFPSVEALRGAILANGEESRRLFEKRQDINR